MELSIPLPKNPHTILHLHLTFLTTSIMLFLTTSTIGDSSSILSPLGSFVYAMPDVCRSAAWSAKPATDPFREPIQPTSFILPSTRQDPASIMPPGQQRFWLGSCDSQSMLAAA